MNITQIFNNIGCEFFIDDNNYFIIGPALPGYNTLHTEHVGACIPYLARTVNNGQIHWEIGTGIVSELNNKIIVKKYQVIQSYGDLSSSGKKTFYLFANADSYNSGFNNVIVKNTDFEVSPVKAIYLVDASIGLINAVLPAADLSKSVEIEFKIIAGEEGRLLIKDNNNFFCSIKNQGSYLSLVSDGISWRIINNVDVNNNTISVLSNTFNTLSDPQGAEGAFQYRNGNAFAGGGIFWGSNNKVLLGSNASESSAKNIFPTSGNFDTIINNTKNQSDFIVHGNSVQTGYLPKNLIFTYDGKLGLNIPSGTKPQTVLHIVNNSCKEAIRIENLSACPSHVPNVTLYHKPTTVSDADTIGKVVLASKNSNNNKIDYASIEAVAKNVSAGSTQGQFKVNINSASSTISTLSTDPSNTNLGYGSSYQLAINNNSGIRLHNHVAGNTVAINNNTINISATGLGGAISIGAPTVSVTGSNISFNQNLTLNNSGVAFPAIPKNQILAINSFGYLAPATGFSFGGIGPRKILSTNNNGVVVGSIDDNAFLPVYNDMKWEKFPFRAASVCLRQLTFLETTPSNEFSLGDQIAIVTGVAPNNGILYRTIEQLELSGSNVSSMLLDQNVTSVDSNITCYSVSKGGVLTNQVHTSGAISDATAIILSTRPEINTVFNTNKKNIDFIVYGLENNPALNIISNASSEPIRSGIYHEYATQLKTPNGDDIEPFPTLFTSAGQGITATNNSVNFGNILSEVWPNRLSTVGSNGRRSFYGTADQNGNAYEWIEDDTHISTSTTQNVCGGSWRTTTSVGLRSIIATPYDLRLDDVGFRVCAKFGSANAVNDLLSFSFVPVGDINNPADTSALYTEQYDNRSGLNIQPQPTSIINLGIVDHPYKISEFEITNAQYAAFLNAVNKTDSYELYHLSMSSSNIGGINRSGSNGSYTYTTKINMSDKPVVFVNYLSAIRFINWLHNGAPDHTTFEPIDTEDGAYAINTTISSVVVTKNRDQNYWLPSLNEWHKAAYFRPISQTALGTRSAVTIRTGRPVEISSGNFASLTVAGATYSDDIAVGTNNASPGSILFTKSSTNHGMIALASGNNAYDINIGPPNNFVINNNSAWDGEYSTYIKSTGIQLATSGTIKFVSSSPVMMSGLSIDDLYVKNLNYRDPITGAPSSGGIYPGTNGGFIFKELNSNNVRASDTLQTIQLGNTSGISLSSATFNQPVYCTELGNLSGYPYLKFDTEVSGMVGKHVSLSTPTGEQQRSLIVESIRIGPALPGFNGSLLAHNGTEPAKWVPNDFLRADGMVWNRHSRRAITFRDNNTFVFSTLDQDSGGTGPVDATTILQEFSIDDTIALYNQNREVFYVKIANITLVDGDQDINASFFTNPSQLEITVCPTIPSTFISGSTIEFDDGTSTQLAYAFSVQKGGYLDMMIEPNATSIFSCDAISSSDKYRFKPSTANTISIRPTIHTLFNKVAEDIDFGIYGYRDTLYNRYEPSLFNKDINGRPTGLVPAFYIDVYKENSVLGNISSGVFRESSGVIASGIQLDDAAKLTINTKSPYVVTTLTGTKRGYIKPNSRFINGSYISGVEDLAHYADLTVNGYAYTNSLITNELVLKNTINNVFIPNAPLTINTLGQLVSIVPPPQPTIPESPSNVVGYAANASVRLSWTAPSNNGNSIITDYDIEYSDGGSWIKYVEGNSSFDTSITVTGLQNGVGYKFRIYAKNIVGISAVSSESSTITPTSNAPSAPRNFTVIDRTANTIIVDWDAPSTTGSSAIQNYIVQAIAVSNPPQALEWDEVAQTIVTTQTNATFINLLPGPRYYFRVRAQNSTNQSGYAATYSDGTDTPPSTDPFPIEDTSNDWDFGEIAFTGVCL